MDPASIEGDGTVAIASFVPSSDARYLAYGVSYGGSDWQEYFIKDMVTRRNLPETLRWVKLSVIAWRGDGFYYSRYPSPSDMTTALSERNEHHQVCYHRIGTPQSADTSVYGDPAHPHRLHFVQTTADERFAALTILDPDSGHAGNALWLQDLGAGKDSFRPIVISFDAEFGVIDNQDDRLLVLTNWNAPNWRLILINPARPDEQDWQTVIPESASRLEAVVPAAGRLFATFRDDAGSRLCAYTRHGRFEHDIALPEIGLVQVFQGSREDADVLYSFAGFARPTTIYRYDVAKRVSSVFRQPKVSFDIESYETRRVFYSSKDGTRIPMFIVHRKAIKLDGHHPLLLYGYGGNGVTVGPRFDPLLMALVERDVVYAVACLRGGGEYGKAWHQAGRRDKKQNVFDDCVAAAEWLQANGYTSKDRLAVTGSSNGGLMVGAVMTQRPDLFKVALPDVGVMDMLRFQEFTIARAWTAEYGSSDDPDMFPVLLAYSPVHNIKKGVSYPATFVTTSEHDDRVVPVHSFKFVAALQANGAGPNPYLLRTETKSGHGPVNLAKTLDERADVYAFLLAQMPEAPMSRSVHQEPGVFPITD